MRIIRYSKKLKLYPWANFDLVPPQEVKEKDLLNSECFDKIVAEVVSQGFDYVVVDQPDEVLISKSNAT